MEGPQIVTSSEDCASLPQALEAARTFKPMSKGAISALLARTSEAAATGKYEPFKTTAGFDGTAHHPQWMG